MTRVYLAANSGAEEIKGNLISHVENAPHRAECVYVCICVPKRDPREILWEQRDSDAPIPRRSLPSVSRNEVYRVVPETSKASWRFPRFARIREFSALEKHLSGTRLRAHRTILIDSAREPIVRVNR